MPFFVKTEIIKKEYLINNDLKRKIINKHIDWVKKLKTEGINIKSGFLVDELNRPGDGGLLILEMNNYRNALKIIKNDPMIKNDLVESIEFSHSEELDTLSYRSILVGFVLLTLGLISGAVWANEAWGTWWSWDPKETWAFISWLFYAAYLHMRISKGWQGRKPALLASTGFLVVLVCYLGVNFLGLGLHSYGWILG